MSAPVQPRDLSDIDAAMLRFSETGDAATLVDEIADILTDEGGNPTPPTSSGPSTSPESQDRSQSDA